MFHLGWFAAEGVPGWGEPHYDISYSWSTPDLAKAMAQELERAAFDFILIEDISAVSDVYGGSFDFHVRRGLGAPKFDPAIVGAYMADATSRIGIIPTLTTSFYPPYLLARLTATLDHMSRGRAGWNVVTSSSELAAYNYGLDGLPEHDLRYDIADEYLDLCTRLWHSWEADAVLADIETGMFADHKKIQRVDFKGKFFASRGPLNVPRPPQGRPVLAQAGNSERGMRFAATHADIVLTPVVHPPAIKLFRDKIRALAEVAGRAPDDVKVMLLIFPRVFDSQAEVDAYRMSLAEIPDEIVRCWLANVSAITTIDMSQYEIDVPLPDHVQTDGSRGTLDWLRRGNATPRLIALRMARLTIDEPYIGTSEQVAEEMARTIEHVGGDGFMISLSMNPENVFNVTTKLVPLLQERGLVRKEYEFETFRENLMAF